MSRCVAVFPSFSNISASSKTSITAGGGGGGVSKELEAGNAKRVCPNRYQKGISKSPQNSKIELFEFQQLW